MIAFWTGDTPFKLCGFCLIPGGGLVALMPLTLAGRTVVVNKIICAAATSGVFWAICVSHLVSPVKAGFGV